MTFGILDCQKILADVFANGQEEQVKMASIDHLILNIDKRINGQQIEKKQIDEMGNCTQRNFQHKYPVCESLKN